LVSQRFLLLTAWYRASSAISYSGTEAEITPCSSWSLMGLCPGRQCSTAAWTRLAAATVRVAVRPPACPLRPRSQGGALA
jgi:hypothetical protein